MTIFANTLVIIRGTNIFFSSLCTKNNLFARKDYYARLHEEYQDLKHGRYCQGSFTISIEWASDEAPTVQQECHLLLPKEVVVESASRVDSDIMMLLINFFVYLVHVYSCKSSM